MLWAQTKGLTVDGKAVGEGERRLALIIGNAAYDTAPLRNPVNDARAMTTTLRTLGFEVTALENASLTEMKRAIDDFGDALRSKGGVGLFYFSGHGIQINGRNFIIPIGARVKGERDVEYESVDAGRVLGKMEDAGNRMNLVILDACRDNPFARSFRSAASGLASLDAASGTFIAYATAPGRTGGRRYGGEWPVHRAVDAVHEDARTEGGRRLQAGAHRRGEIQRWQAGALGIVLTQGGFLLCRVSWRGRHTSSPVFPRETSRPGPYHR